MPAKLLKRATEEGSFSRIYNTGVDSRNIFNDDTDYQVFLGFLNDYLTAPKGSNDIKKSFMVKGRTFHGVPHQPKNYQNQLELIAYRLLPDRFDLVLKQLKRGALEKFMRSLSTRYSIYFNKKNNRTGVVFAGPYKSVEITNGPDLLSLTRLLHRETAYSSFEDYIGQKQTPWIMPDVVLKYFESKKKDGLKEFSDYKDYIEKDKPQQKISEEPKTDTQTVDEPAPAIRIPEIAATLVIFLILLGLGLRHINVANASIAQAPAKTSVLSESTVSTPSPTPTAATKITVAVKIMDGTGSVNIRKEPTTSSPIIGKATNGQIFEMVSIVESTWYEVKMDNGSAGYISSKYIVQQTNE